MKDMLDWLAFMTLGCPGPLGRWADRRVRTWFSADGAVYLDELPVG